MKTCNRIGFPPLLFLPFIGKNLILNNDIYCYFIILWYFCVLLKILVRAISIIFCKFVTIYTGIRFYTKNSNISCVCLRSVMLWNWLSSLFFPSFDWNYPYFEKWYYSLVHLRSPQKSLASNFNYFFWICKDLHGYTVLHQKLKHFLRLHEKHYALEFAFLPFFFFFSIIFSRLRNCLSVFLFLEMPH